LVGLAGPLRLWEGVGPPAVGRVAERRAAAASDRVRGRATT